MFIKRKGMAYCLLCSKKRCSLYVYPLGRHKIQLFGRTDGKGFRIFVRTFPIKAGSEESSLKTLRFVLQLLCFRSRQPVEN